MSTEDLRSRLAKAKADLATAQERAKPRLEQAALADELRITEREIAFLASEDRRMRLPDPDAAETLMVETFPDTFIVHRNSAGHREFTAALKRRGALPVKQQKDSEPIYRQYALAAVVDWNGTDLRDDLASAEATHKLDAYLTANPGLLTPITDLAGKLAGVFADERSKSG